MKTALLVLSTIAAFASIAHGLPGGAPNDACPQVSPTAGGHLVGPQNTPSPYNITGLPSEYTPGAAYICKPRRGVWFTQRSRHAEIFLIQEQAETWCW